MVSTTVFGAVGPSSNLGKTTKDDCIKLIKVKPELKISSCNCSAIVFTLYVFIV